MEFCTTGHVDGGHLRVTPRALAAINAAVQGWRNCQVLIRIEKVHAIRSVEANRYYFGVVLKRLSDYTGYTVDELHEWAKARFIPKHVAMLDKNGDVKDDMVIGGTTTRLNRVQFYEYVEAIRQFAAESLELDIPDPDPRWRKAA